MFLEVAGAKWAVMVKDWIQTSAGGISTLVVLELPSVLQVSGRNSR